MKSFGPHFKDQATDKNNILQNDSSLCLHLKQHTQLLRNSYMTAFSRKHLNYMLHERGRDTETKVNWPKLSIHVSPDKVGNYPLHGQGPTLV